jgi:hypothetical protein
VVGPVVLDPVHLERMDAFRKLNAILDPGSAESLSSAYFQLGTFRGDLKAWKSDLTEALRKGLAMTIESIGEDVLLDQLILSNPDEARRLWEIGLFNWVNEVELNGQFDPMFALLEKNTNAARRAGDKQRAELDMSITKEVHSVIYGLVSGRRYRNHSFTKLWDKEIIAQHIEERQKTPVLAGEAGDLAIRLNVFNRNAHHPNNPIRPPQFSESDFDASARNLILGNTKVIEEGAVELFEKVKLEGHLAIRIARKENIERAIESANEEMYMMCALRYGRHIINALQNASKPKSEQIESLLGYSRMLHMAHLVSSALKTSDFDELDKLLTNKATKLADGKNKCTINEIIIQRAEAMFQDLFFAKETDNLRAWLCNLRGEEERLARYNAQRMAKNKSAVVLNPLRATVDVDSEKAALRATQERLRYYAAKAEWSRVTE